jgi:hypothetical protein
MAWRTIWKWIWFSRKSDSLFSWFNFSWNFKWHHLAVLKCNINHAIDFDQNGLGFLHSIIDP